MVDVVTDLMNTDTLHFSHFTPDSSTSPFKDSCVFKPSGQLAFTLNMQQAWGPAYPPFNLGFVGTVIQTNVPSGFPLVRWEVQKADDNLSEVKGEITTTLFSLLPRIESAACQNFVSLKVTDILKQTARSECHHQWNNSEWVPLAQLRSGIRKERNEHIFLVR